MQPSTYIHAEHPVILIDGVPLDKYLHHLYPDQLYLGLIPTMTDWIGLKEETDLVIERFYSEIENIVLPVLMCPDDCDLTCTLVVTEVLKTENEVIWKRIGIDASHIGIPYNYEQIGTEVTWLNEVPEMKFNKDTYFEELKAIYNPMGGYDI